MFNRLLILTTLALVTWSCGKDDEEKCAFVPEVSSKVTIQYESFEDSLVNVGSKPQLVSFLTRHPVIRDFILNRNEFPDDSVFINEIYKRFSNPHIDTLLLETKRVFGNQTKLKMDFETAFSNLKYYYPDFVAPKVQTVVTGLMGSDLYVSDSLIVVGLDYYLGHTGKYRPQMYDYLLRQYEPENIVPSCMMIYGISEPINQTDMNDKSVLADMISYGKAFYFAKQMMPCTPDSVFIWYSAKEIKDSRQNQDLVWSRLIQDRVLYSTSHLTKQKYLGERPKTIDVGPECPGRIGQFVGWQIVNAYMENHPEEPLPALMKKRNAREILEQSNYTSSFRR